MTIRQTISMLIAGMLLCSAVGCSASKPANTTDPANSAATEEPAKEITKFTGMFNATTDSLYENNEIRDIIAEKTGYILYEEWLPDRAEADKIFGDMLISGKYPDFVSPDGQNMQRMIKEHALIPLDWNKKVHAEAVEG